jgi:hypothetical protein
MQGSRFFARRNLRFRHGSLEMAKGDPKTRWLKFWCGTELKALSYLLAYGAFTTGDYWNFHTIAMKEGVLHSQEYT